ncbi:DUF2851 family protein [soil metagenome]
MKEEFIHYIWKTRQFNPDELKTEDGKSIEIIYPGEHNHSSGPDFFNAQIIVDNMDWAGNVEIHTKASDWLKHKHQFDNAYHNVILHVVYEADVEIRNHRNEIIPTLVLAHRIDDQLYRKFLNLRNSRTKIPCANQIKHVPEILKTAWLSRLLVERLERKVGEISNDLNRANMDWEGIFFRHLAGQFGMKENAEPFQWMMTSIPGKIIHRQFDEIQLTEALLFGQSGLLPEESSDAYTSILKREYAHLKLKYNLQAIPPHWWKFMRMRPNNFPTIRISQFACLIHRRPQLFRLCMEISTLSEMTKLFEVSASDYWTNHFRFGMESKGDEKAMGRQTINSILINTILPFRFLYGKWKGDEQLSASAIALLEKLPAENNKLIREWKKISLFSHTAAESQGAIELSKRYCDKKNCLNCEIGNYILEKKEDKIKRKSTSPKSCRGDISLV